MNAAILAALITQVPVDLSADPRLDKPISLTMRAKSTVGAVSELSTASGLHLRSIQMFARDPLMMSLKDAKLRDCMTAIAQTVGGSWEKEETGYVLVRSDAQWRALKKQDDDILARLLVEAKPGYGDMMPTEMAGAPVGAAPSIAEMRAAMSEGDEGFQKLAETAAKLVPPSALLGLGIEERIVFSTMPNSMQKSLSGLQKQALEPAIKLYKVPKAGGEQVVDEETGEILGRDDSQPGPLVGAHLIVRRESATRWTFNLKWFDATGKVLEVSTMLDVQVSASKLRKELKPTNPEQKIDLHPFSKKIQDIGRMFSMEAPETNFDFGQELKLAFQKPDEIDPLFTLPTDFFFAFAEDQKANVIGSLPDDFAEGIMTGAEASTEIKRDAAFRGLADSVVTECGTVKCLTPQFRSYAASARLDRKALRKFMDAERNGGLTIGALKDFAVTYPERSGDLMAFYGLIGGSGAVSMFGGSPDWTALRFLASLTPQQEAAVTAGQALAYATMSPGSRYAYYYAVINESSQIFGMGLDVEELTETIARPTPAQDGTQVRYADITDLLGGQLGASAHVLGSPSVKDIVKLADMAKFPIQIPPLSASEYAMIKQSMEQPESAAWSNMFPKLEPLYLGVRSTLKLTFNIAPGVSSARRINTDRIGDKAMKYAELPEAFRKKVETFKLPWGNEGPGDAPPPAP